MSQKSMMLFEVSWEVCNKVGGIYTVIKSKLPEAKRKFGDNYVLIGPLFDNNPEFREETGIDLTGIKHKLQGAGITARIGRWNCEEAPRVILVKYKDTLDQNKLLYSLWEDYGVDSMTGGWDYVEPVLFSTMAGRVIEALSPFHAESSIVAQFHEWISGAGVLYLKKRVPHVATVFSTHATVLGRAMAGNGVDIYSVMSGINTDSEASRFGVTSKHSMESTAAREADCFTTVSEITALEAKHILHVEPDAVTPNGFPVKDIPSFDQDPGRFGAARARLLEFASRFLKKDLVAGNTMIVSTSGRYEFHNKGLDLFIETLGDLRRNQQSLGRQVVAFFFVLTGHMHKNDEHQAPDRFSKIVTHPLMDSTSDPILSACARQELNNTPEDKVNVIFVPAFLNGRDGVLDIEYYDALAGCDLTVYPSYYEPWGYTPLESMAYSVPTVSTDLAGFGRWAITREMEGAGVRVLRRQNRSFDEVKIELKDHILAVAALNDEARAKVRGGLKTSAMNADWEVFLKEYAKAFAIAEKERENRRAGKVKTDLMKFDSATYRGADSLRPRFRQFSVKTSLPAKLERLRELAYNVWWAWTADAHELFSRLDPTLYERIGNNPVSLLEMVDPQKLDEVAENESYLSLYESVMKKFDKYMGQKESLLKDLSPITPEHPVAYFSMEFGLHESLPLYSGGLGILSGDHIKSASDLNIPLVGVGLLYKNGYFKQGISKEGEQKVEYFHNDFSRMPLREVNKNNERVTISVEMPGRVVYARVWEARVGRIPVYMLDTNIQENNPSDRDITGRLYRADKRVRMEQEILLGIGGVRMLEELNIQPSVFHLNEGHSAFLILERFINLMKYNNLDYATAREVIRSSTVFTTHTPVPAGNETFDMQLAENYLKQYVEGNGMSWQDVYEAGHKFPGDTGPYEMTVLALKNTCRRNGVSKLHGVVSRKMWWDLWRGVLMEEVPISHITNGVHAGTWLTIEMKHLITKYCSLDLDEDILKKKELTKILKVPDDVLWQAHVTLKEKLISCVKEKVTNNWVREGEDPALLDRFLAGLSSNPLTIGFARRFATYKRSTLFMKDLDRLKALVNNKKFPVRLIFAGKAHPEDRAGFDLIREIVALSKQDEFLGKIIFVEDYDMKLARRMISGVDVWLNNPRRPLEASGTSGQKAGINGAINFSILDGWWDEGFDGLNGWAIGEKKEYKNPETQDLADSDSFYEQLENELVPMYYSRNNAGIPEKWIKVMKNSIISTLSQFNTHRMLRDYSEEMYRPAARQYFAMIRDGFKKAREVAEWKRSMSARFSSVHIRSIFLEGIQGDNLNVNDELRISLEVDLGRASKDELSAQVVIIQDSRELGIGYSGVRGFYDEEVIKVPLEAVEEKDGVVKYLGVYRAVKSGKFNYGIRILPHSREIDSIADLNLVYWA